MIRLTKFIQSNKWSLIGLVLFFIGGWYFDNYFNKDKLGEINSNLGLTVAQTKGFSHAAKTCNIVYEYVVSGNPYRGQSACLKGKEKCEKFLLAYSRKDPTKAVIIFDFPLDKKILMGADLINMKHNLDKDILSKWIKKQPTIIDKSYITYSSKREQRRKMCD